MKKVVFFALLLFFSPSLMALNGVCCAYGHDPKSPSPYNYQQQYFVECYCNCADTMHQCVECGHFHAPKEEQYITNVNEQCTKTITFSPPVTQKDAFALFAKKAISSRQKRNNRIGIER